MLSTTNKGIKIVICPFSSAICNHCVSSTPSRPFLHTQDMYFVFVQLLSSGSAWFAIIIIVITCLFPDVVKKVFYRHLQPTSTQKSQVTWGENENLLSKTFTGCCVRLLKGKVWVHSSDLKRPIQHLLCRDYSRFHMHPAGPTSSCSV